ncbi:DUF1648 domain-containing protein [Corynebacterium aquatimens]|uniref:Membrane protein n=1 Tax=Corynebacterium aquatimens TaxID=1190508 RepID=A0A931E1D5_9CORY|nr:DUF1648 domain-containing protein [Corynebacterium aquatimens]MBG6121855.1 putative membrane protein [Corynebacterium aquatimens]WJY65607.1 hypothetical protein CAQUA_04470 [Corynebacterium aquatimens]
MSTRKIYAIAVGVVLATLVFILVNYDQIPDPIPVHFDSDGNVNRTTPKNFFAATNGVWFALGLVAVFYTALPTPRMARIRMDVPADSDIPFSDTASDKAATLLAKTGKAMAWTALGAAVTLCLLEITTTIPAFSAWTPVAIALIIIGSILCVALFFRIAFTWSKELAEMPTDEAEKIRAKHFKYGSGMGFYKEPNDPMVMMLASGGEAKVDLNFAHAPVRRWALTMGVTLALFIAYSIVSATL